MIVAINESGRPTLDRKTPFSTWSNLFTRQVFESLCDDEQFSFADLLEGAALAAEEFTAFRHLWVTKAKEAKNANRKRPRTVTIEEAQALTPEECFEHLDLKLKATFTKEEVIAQFTENPPKNLDELDRAEDEAIEGLHQKALDAAAEKATFTKGDTLSGIIKVSRNERRYAEEVKRISEQRDRENAARARHREQRRALLLGAALLLAPQLRQEGNPQSHRQYHDHEWREAAGPAAKRRGSSTYASTSSFETEGGATREDRKALKRDLS